MPKKPDYAALYTLRSDGRYQGYYRDAAGKRHAVCDRDPEQLHRKLQELEHPEPKLPTFREMAERWENEHVSKLNRGSQKTYKAPLEALIDDLGDIPITEITAADVNRIMLEEKAKGYSYKHAACKKSIVKQIMDMAVVDKDIPVQYNPTASVRVERGMKKGHVEAPEDEIIKTIQANLDKPFGDFVAMLLFTGMRTEEAVALTWGDIGKDEITVRRAVDLHGTPLIKEAKTEAGERRIPILTKHKPFLQRPVGAKATDYVFPGPSGKLLTRGQITSRWLNWCKAAGLAEQKIFENRHRGKTECTRTEWRPLVTPHQLRHNYATVLFEQNVDVITTKDVMGHKDIETTRKIYTSLRQKHRQEEVKKIDDGF